ncbi:MAG TPA: hypothetical protein VLB02_01655 [Candidatus Paceibacterota bacterium]|nr:hypothetical protein [Candidatus Paceibacterota bacterium]
MGRGTKYVFVFILTCGVFAISWYVSSYFSQQRIAEIRNIQNKVATDILSSETDFSLLQELSCQDLNRTVTSEELGSLASKISFSEQSANAQDEILLLKKQYSILEVKDFLLKKRVSERCKTPLTTIFYFYSTEDDCDDCVKQGYVLDAIREKYPDVHIYSFDYNLDLSTIRALRLIYKIADPLPVLVVNGKTYNGFNTVEAVESLLPKEFIKQEQQKTLKAEISYNTTTLLN